MPGQERYGIYCRISRVRRQDGKVETLGVERQEPPSRALVERMGGTVAKVYVDNDISAYSGKRRPDYEAMLADVKAGAIAGIVAWHPNRLTRQPIENEGLISLVEAHGTKLATVLAGEHDLNTPAGRLNFRLQGSIARYESEHKAERLMAKSDELAADGKPHGGPRPFGYEQDGHTVRESEAGILRDAAVALLERGESLNAAARLAGERLGRPVDATTLRRHLTRARTAGLREHRGEIVGPATWPAILDRETYDRLVALFNRPGRKAQGRPETFTYSGIVRCARCRKPMVGAGQGRMGCGSGRGYDGCGATIGAAPLEAHLDELVIDAIAGEHADRFAGVLADRLEAAADAAALVAERDRLRGELEALAAAKGELTIAEYLELRRDLAARLEAAERAIAALPEVGRLLDIPRAESELRAWWAKATVAQKRLAITSVLDDALVTPAARGQRFDGARQVDPHWNS